MILTLWTRIKKIQIIHIYIINIISILELIQIISISIIFEKLFIDNIIRAEELELNLFLENFLFCNI